MKRVLNLFPPLVGIGLAVLVWWGVSLKVPDLPSPMRTWEESRIYVLQPFDKRGEMDQGILLFTWYSLILANSRTRSGFSA